MTQIMQTGQQFSHRNISHSVSSVDLIGPCLTNQPRIHILKIIDATCVGAFSTHRCRSGQPRSLSVTTRHVSTKTAHFEQFC